MQCLLPQLVLDKLVQYVSGLDERRTKPYLTARVTQHVSNLKTSKHEALRSVISPVDVEPTTVMQRDIRLVLARSQSVSTKRG